MLFFCSAKALPLIKRGKYKHLCGSRRDEPYTLFDIFSVSNITVITIRFLPGMIFCMKKKHVYLPFQT